ncbi:MAG: hypothetical protein ACWA42_05870 [Lutibacter sp.]
MCTKKKSKWFSLISIGLLITVFPNFIERISSWHIPELFKYIIMIGGISIEIIGVILITRDKKQLNKL